MSTRPSRIAPIMTALLLTSVVSALGWNLLPGLGPQAAFAQETEAGRAGAPGPRTSSCLACHGSPEWFADKHIQEIVRDYEGGAHQAADLGCEDCHGGNPDPALSQDIDAAMSPEWEANPFIGVPSAEEIPAFCGRCHSDPTYMRRFQPDPRIDQVREYLTSQHGQALLRRGDPKVATCVDCHGIHGILGPGDPQSPVYPANVAETCHKCHSKAEYMAGYTDDAGRPLPVDQYARWTQSVHAAAMFEKEDLTAPTCNDCHGNHGAAPPGIDSIAFVCGQCHGREAGLFRDSTKREGFQTHDAYIEGMGPGACAECHAADSPQAGLEQFVEFSECSTCHGNHAVVRPSVAMLAPLPEIPCAFCHEGVGPLAPGTGDGTAALPPEPDDVMAHYAEVRDDLLAQAEREGLQGAARFDWMVDQALGIEPHHLPATEAPAETASEEEEETDARADVPAAEHSRAGLALPANLRPEFRRLFEKFRIGK
ncbi:MAG: cytochrome c3 family protein, partial [Acidobacteriota bacterium]